jgi:hypothetical protein
LAYDSNKEEMVGSWSISSSPNERKFFNGNNTLKIKREESGRHTTKITKGMHNIDASENLLTIKQPPRTFLDKRINFKVVNMFSVRLEHGHFNKRLQHFCKNLHI